MVILFHDLIDFAFNSWYVKGILCHFSDQECVLIYRNEIHKLKENQWGQRKKQ